MVSWGRKKNGSWEKNEKGGKKEKNYIIKGEKGLKNASFWTINSKKNRRGGFPNPLPSGKKI